MNEERGYVTRTCPECHEEYDFFEESDKLPGVIQEDNADLADYGRLCAKCIKNKFEDEARLYWDDEEEDEEDRGEPLSVSDAADIWRSSGADEDNRLGYSEEELRNVSIK